MANSFIDFIRNTVGIMANAYTQTGRTQIELMRNRMYELLQIVSVPNGTSTSDFYLEWLPYGVPENAIVVEKSTPPTYWVTTDGGGTWSDLTSGATAPTGSLLIGTMTLQTGYLWMDGSAQLISTYSTLNSHLNSVIGASELRKYNRLLQNTWNSANDVDFDFIKAKNGIANGDSVNLYWDGGSRLTMTIGSATTGGFNLSGGVGDSIPNDAIQSFYWEFSATKFIVPDARDVLFLGASDMGGLNSGILNNVGLQTIRSFGTFPQNNDYGENLLRIGVQIKT